jgi:hypothetical protein
MPIPLLGEEVSRVWDQVKCGECRARGSKDVAKIHRAIAGAEMALCGRTFEEVSKSGDYVAVQKSILTTCKDCLAQEAMVHAEAIDAAGMWSGRTRCDRSPEQVARTGQRIDRSASFTTCPDCLADIQKEVAKIALDGLSRSGVHHVVDPTIGASAAPRKDDAPGGVAKPMWRLLPWEALEDVVGVLTWACTRRDPPPYGADSWRAVENAVERYSDAMDRHLARWRVARARRRNGWEARDAESGMKELAHVAVCALFLLALDRPDPVPAPPAKPAA